jgi:glycosyltransferase involved in cell wall biosynthesis
LKVLYSLGAKFGGTGIGRTAARSVIAITREHELRVAAAGFDDDLTGSFDRIRIKPPWRWPFTDKKRYRLRRAVAFDDAVSELIHPDLGIFHSWNGFCLEGLHKARKLGITSVVVRASSHMLTQMEILRGEFEKYGIRDEVEIQEMIDRCVAEYDAADYVQVPSEFVKKSFLDKGFPEEKLICLPFGVDLDRYVQAPHEDPVFRLLFIGRIGLRKGVHYLLDAWRKLRLPKSELVLAGNIEPRFGRVLEEYESLEGLVLPGFVKNPAKLYASSSAFIFPSLEEGSALVTYEAMASGLPVITTFNSGSIVRDGKDGFIVPIRDVDAICASIEKLHRNRELAGKMGAGAREYVTQYTWEHYSSELARYYKTIEEKRSDGQA